MDTIASVDAAEAAQAKIAARMRAPLVSVILPTYNRAKTLCRAVDSVLAQTHRELELIVVDDGSTDETQVLLATYRDPRLKLIAPGRLGSAAKARNRGLMMAQGEFVAFQDSDDVWLIEKLERQLALARQHPEAALIACGYIVLPVGGGSPRYHGVEMLDRSRDFRALFRGYGSQISTPAWLIRRDHLLQAGAFDESLSTWEDWELSIRLEATGSCRILDEPLVLAFETLGSVKRSTALYTPTLEAVMSKHSQWLSTLPRVRARHAWLCMTYELDVGNPDRARHYLWQAIRHDPTYWKSWTSIVRRLPRLLAASG